MAAQPTISRKLPKTAEPAEVRISHNTNPDMGAPSVSGKDTTFAERRRQAMSLFHRERRGTGPTVVRRSHMRVRRGPAAALTTRPPGRSGPPYRSPRRTGRRGCGPAHAASRRPPAPLTGHLRAGDDRQPDRADVD